MARGAQCSKTFPLSSVMPSLLRRETRGTAAPMATWEWHGLVGIGGCWTQSGGWLQLPVVGTCAGLCARVHRVIYPGVDGTEQRGMVEVVLFTYMLLSCPLRGQERAQSTTRSRSHPVGLAAPTGHEQCPHRPTKQSGYVDSFIPKDVSSTDLGIPFLETV